MSNNLCPTLSIAARLLLDELDHNVEHTNTTLGDSLMLYLSHPHYLSPGTADTYLRATLKNYSTADEFGSLLASAAALQQLFP